MGGKEIRQYRRVQANDRAGGSDELGLGDKQWRGGAADGCNQPEARSLWLPTPNSQKRAFAEEPGLRVSVR